MSRRTQRRSGSRGPRVDPLISYLLFAGIAVGTWQMSRPWRQTLLWLFLAVAFLLYVELRPVKVSYSLRSVGWGALIGTVMSIPLLAFAWSYLSSFAVQLFATTDPHLLFYQLCLAAAPIEELYFRGFVQRERGMNIAVLLYTGAALLYFIPGLNLPLLAIVVVTVAYALSGFVYSYVYARHGLSAAITSHVLFNLIILVFPSLVEYTSRL